MRDSDRWNEYLDEHAKLLAGMKRFPLYVKFTGLQAKLTEAVARDPESGKVVDAEFVYKHLGFISNQLLYDFYLRYKKLSELIRRCQEDLAYYQHKKNMNWAKIGRHGLDQLKVNYLNMRA